MSALITGAFFLDSKFSDRTVVEVQVLYLIVCKTLERVACEQNVAGHTRIPGSNSGAAPTSGAAALAWPFIHHLAFSV